MGIFPTGDKPGVLRRAVELSNRRGGRKFHIDDLKQARKEFAAFNRIQEFGALKKARRDFPRFRKNQTFGIFARRIDQRTSALRS